MSPKNVVRRRPLWGRFQFHAQQAAGAIVGWAAFIVSYIEVGQPVISHERGDCASERLGARVAIFCHFNKHGRILDHTRRYLESLRAEGFDLVFVTNSRRLAQPDLSWIRHQVAHLVFRRNLGYDFAAWRDAMAVCALPTADTCFLLLANDSVYGPFRPLAPILQRVDFDQADVWSMTDSWQHRFHLQSYFLAFGPKAFRADAFRDFWKSVANVRSKWWIVRRYELRMARVLIAAGLRCRALWPYIEVIEALRDAAAREGACQFEDEERGFGVDAVRRRNTERALSTALRQIPLNPTADMWQMLIEQGCPFLKRELLRKNPSRVADVAAWYSVVGQIDTSSRELILRDLEQSLKRRSP